MSRKQPTQPDYPKPDPPPAPPWYGDVFDVVRKHKEHCRCHTCLLWRELQELHQVIEAWKSACTYPGYGYISVRTCYNCQEPYPEWSVSSLSKCPACREGTALARLTAILNEFRKRFPGVDEYSSYPPEIRYFEALDAVLPTTVKIEEA